MKFHYKATDKQGRIVEDTAIADDKFALAKQLRERDLSLIAAENNQAKGLKKILISISNFGTVSMNEKIMFGKNMGSMLEAGLSLSRAIAVMERQSRNKKFKNQMLQMHATFKFMYL